MFIEEFLMHPYLYLLYKNSLNQHVTEVQNKNCKTVLSGESGTCMYTVSPMMSSKAQTADS